MSFGQEEYWNKVQARALELSKGMPPWYNIAPLIDLISNAWALGLDVCKREPAATAPVAEVVNPCGTVFQGLGEDQAR